MRMLLNLDYTCIEIHESLQVKKNLNTVNSAKVAAMHLYIAKTCLYIYSGHLKMAQK